MPGDPSEQTPFLRPVETFLQASFRPTRPYESHVRNDYGLKFSLANPTFTATETALQKTETASQQIFHHAARAPARAVRPPVVMVPKVVPTGFSAGSSSTLAAEAQPHKAWLTFDSMFSTARR